MNSKQYREGHGDRDGEGGPSRRDAPLQTLGAERQPPEGSCPAQLWGTRAVEDKARQRSCSEGLRGDEVQGAPAKGTAVPAARQGATSSHKTGRGVPWAMTAW